MPFSFPKGQLYIPIDGVGSLSTNQKTGLPNAVGNMPNIPALQNGPGDNSFESSGPYTTFFLDRKTGKATLTIRTDKLGVGSSVGGNYVDQNGNYLPPDGTFLLSIRENPVETNINTVLSTQGNPANDTTSGRDNDSLRRALNARTNGTAYKLRGTPSTPTSLIVNKMKIFNAFLDYSGKQFVHGLDYFQGGIGSKEALSNSRDLQYIPGDIYVGSFVTTRLDNEDPTYLGYDIKIKTQTSPLFNGELETFIINYSNYTEIGSRLTVLQDFIVHIRKFINYDTADVDDTINTYYLKKLSGLDNLVEKTGGEKLKMFTDYGKDKLTLTFREDVTQNIGYLASLYKTLSWSRINGKQIIPENLLRFDCEITVSEVKKYNRLIKNADKIETYVDNISKYVYTLYECQMLFDNLPHGNDLDMSKVEIADDYSIDINYKYSTMKFIRFRYDSDRKIFGQKILDNKNNNVTKPSSDDPNTRLTIQQTGEISVVPIDYPALSTNPSITFEAGSLEELKFNDSLRRQPLPQPKSPLGTPSPFTNLKQEIRQAFANEINRQISKQVGLIFKSIENIRRRIPFGGQLNEPTNVYTGRGMFENDLINAGRNFVGNSLRNLFGNPRTMGNLPRGGGSRR